MKSADTDRNDTLSTPLSVCGTPKELDEALPEQLVEFARAHFGLSSTLNSVKEEMNAAAKAAREAARAPQAEKIAPDPAPARQLSGSLFSDAPAGEL